MALIAPDRVTVWNPGILGTGRSDGIPLRDNIYLPGGGFDGFSINPALADSDITSTTAAIQNALNSASPDQVVLLPPGRFIVNPISIPSRRVLRGSGPGNGGGSGTCTRLWGNSISILLYTSYLNYGTPQDLTADAAQGADRVMVSTVAAATFNAGDLIRVDQLDDLSSTVIHRGGLPYFIRGNNADGSSTSYGPYSANGHRCQGQVCRILRKEGNALVIYDAASGQGAPLHLGYRVAQNAQVFRITNPAVNVGIEDIYLTGASLAGGAGMVEIRGGVESWIKRCEFDGSIAGQANTNGVVGTGNGMMGIHAGLTSSYRSVIRDSYVHDSTNGGQQGGGSYGLVVMTHSAECLVENNIVFLMNKPFTARASGGGNVIAYNYLDDAKTTGAGQQETTIDPGHAAFPHMDLYEGNEAAHIAADNVWGSSGWITLYRNRASGIQHRTPTAPEGFDVTAIGIEDESCHYMNVVGNVVGASGAGQTEQITSAPPGTYQRAVWRISQGYGGGSGTHDLGLYNPAPFAAGTVGALLYRHGNFSENTGLLSWDASNADHALPNSLYLQSKPACFGASDIWPPVNPLGATASARYARIPARSRYDAGTPNALTAGSVPVPIPVDLSATVTASLSALPALRVSPLTARVFVSIPSGVHRLTIRQVSGATVTVAPVVVAGVIPLASSVNASLSAAPDLRAMELSVPLSSVAACGLSAQPVMTVRQPISAAVAARAAVTGSVSVRVPLAAVVDAGLSASVGLSLPGEVALSSVVSQGLSSAPVLTVTVPLGSAMPIASSVVANLTLAQSIPLASTVSAGAWISLAPFVTGISLSSSCSPGIAIDANLGVVLYAPTAPYPPSRKRNSAKNYYEPVSMAMTQRFLSTSVIEENFRRIVDLLGGEAFVNGQPYVVSHGRLNEANFGTSNKFTNAQKVEPYSYFVQQVARPRVHNETFEFHGVASAIGEGKTITIADAALSYVYDFGTPRVIRYDSIVLPGKYATVDLPGGPWQFDSLASGVCQHISPLIGQVISRSSTPEFDVIRVKCSDLIEDATKRAHGAVLTLTFKAEHVE